MRPRRTSAEHQEAVNRRLALLSAELSAVRHPDADTAWPEPTADATSWWDGPLGSAGRAGSRDADLGVVEEAPPAPVEGPTSPPVLPDPGRHAARRSRPGARPDALRGRLVLDPAQLAVVAVLVAVGLAVTCWWVVRGDADPASDVTQAPSRGLVSLPTGDAPVPGAVREPLAPPTTVTVDVAGKVRRPGIAVLDSGSRVVDALEAAGGARPGADLSGLNLARVLVDGEQVMVGVPVPPGAAAAAVPSTGATAGPLVNLNTASETELDTLPEVGPVTAQSILAWRHEHGGFTAVDELLEVDGIGDATLARIAPYVTV
jgi:competence protein ComEA